MSKRKVDKKVKKFISLLLAVLMLCSISVSAFAAETHNVYAKYVAGAKVDAMKVTVTWGDMKFTYSASSEEWDTENLEWVTKDGAAWKVDNENGNVISITNRSSVAVKADMSFASTTKGVDGSFSSASVTVGSAAEAKQAVTESVTFMPTGALDSSVTSSTSVGTITVTLS